MMEEVQKLFLPSVCAAIATTDHIAILVEKDSIGSDRALTFLVQQLVQFAAVPLAVTFRFPLQRLSNVHFCPLSRPRLVFFIVLCARERPYTGFSIVPDTQTQLCCRVFSRRVLKRSANQSAINVVLSPKFRARGCQIQIANWHKAKRRGPEVEKGDGVEARLAASRVCEIKECTHWHNTRMFVQHYEKLLCFFSLLAW